MVYVPKERERFVMARRCQSLDQAQRKTNQGHARARGQAFHKVHRRLSSSKFFQNRTIWVTMGPRSEDNVYDLSSKVCRSQAVLQLRKPKGGICNDAGAWSICKVGGCIERSSLEFDSVIKGGPYPRYKWQDFQSGVLLSDACHDYCTLCSEILSNAM